MNKFFQTDWVDFVCDKYKKIPDLHKKTFWFLFAIINFAFIFHTINFLWGDHEWQDIQTKVLWDGYLNEGRYSANLIKDALLGEKILPILNNLFGFLGLTLSTVLLMDYWKAPKKLFDRVMLGSLLTVTPVTIIWLWFARHTVENLFAPFFVLIGLLLAKKADDYNNRKSLIFTVFAVYCLLFALGIYPVLIQTIFVMFLSKLVVDAIAFDFSNNKIKDFFAAYKYNYIIIAVSILLYKAYLMCLKSCGILWSEKNVIMIPFPDMIDKIPVTMAEAFNHLYSYDYTFLPQTITSFFAVLIILAFAVVIWHIVSKSKTKKECFVGLSLVLILLALSLFSTRLAWFLSKYPDALDQRGDFYGLIYFRVFMILLLFKYAKIGMRNISALLCVILFWVCIVTDFDCLKAYKLGFEAEKMRFNRIMYTLETRPEFNYKTPYIFIQIGAMKPLRPNFITRKSAPEMTLGEKSFMPPWKNHEVWNFYAENKFIGRFLHYYDEGYYSDNNLTQIDLYEIAKRFDLNKMKQWPDKSFLGIKDNVILMVFSDRDLESVKAMYKVKK